MWRCDAQLRETKATLDETRQKLQESQEELHKLSNYCATHDFSASSSMFRQKQAEWREERSRMTQQLAQMSQRCFEMEESSQRQQVADEELEALRFQCDLQRQRTAESERMHAALKLQVEQVTEQERANTVQKRKLLMLYDDLQQQQGLVLAKEGELNRLSDELDRLRKSEAALQAALAAEAASKESLHDRAQKLEADLRENEGRLQQALAELRTARSAGQLQRSAEDEVSVLKEALHNIRVEYSEQTEMLHAVKTLRDKLMHQSAETEELLSKEEDRNAGFMEELDFLRAQLDHETREKARLAEAHGDAKLRIEAAERAMEREQALLMQLADLQSSAAQAEDAASANALLNARITGLEAQLSDIRLALQGERQRNRELSARWKTCSAFLWRKIRSGPARCEPNCCRLRRGRQPKRYFFKRKRTSFMRHRRKCSDCGPYNALLPQTTTFWRSGTVG